MNEFGVKNGFEVLTVHGDREQGTLRPGNFWYMSVHIICNITDLIYLRTLLGEVIQMPHLAFSKFENLEGI